MAIPKQSDIELPLLRVIRQLGGQARPKEVYAGLEQIFEQLTEADKAERLESGGSRWENRVQFARQNLVLQGFIDKSIRGIWKLTPSGERQAQQPDVPNAGEILTPRDDLAQLWDAYEEAQRERLLTRLKDLSPAQFEIFGREFLRAYGFVDLAVTNTGPDGGIDGYGRLRVGVATMRAAFQCKRWDGTVGRTEVDKFRGAIQGEFEQGIFFTTSTFSAKAQQASIKKGAVPVVLFDGDELVRIMLEKSIGIIRRPLCLFEEAPFPGLKDLDSEV